MTHVIRVIGTTIRPNIVFLRRFLPRMNTDTGEREATPVVFKSFLLSVFISVHPWLISFGCGYAAPRNPRLIFG